MTTHAERKLEATEHYAAECRARLEELIDQTDAELERLQVLAWQAVGEPGPDYTALTLCTLGRFLIGAIKADAI